MTDALKGQGILVTRPSAQSGELTAALAAAGGTIFQLPVIEIKPRSPEAILPDLAALPSPDIVVYVSGNAVSCGAETLRENQDARVAPSVAAIGPATKAALEDAGVDVDISPVTGFDSERLLEHKALNNVTGRQVLIVRGQSGRELLGDTLRQRGATVNYVAVYTRTTATPDLETLSQLIENWENGAIDAVIVMSVESLTGLLKILPADAHPLLRKTRLVTPSKRVIQTATESMPDVNTVLADSPRVDSLVKAVVEKRT